MQNQKYTIHFFLTAWWPTVPPVPEQRPWNWWIPAPSQPHLYTAQDIYGMEYFHWPAWASCLAVLPPSSCTPAH